MTGKKGPDAIQYGRISYAQEGEDLVLKRFFGDRQNGFYVDIGAHHPIRFSNTYLFYTEGWRGINVDAMPGSMDMFCKLRPGDINIEAAVNDETAQLVFHKFNEPALNTFSRSEAQKKDGLPGYHITGTVELETTTLATILDTHLTPGTRIDFLSIDVEGLDLPVLRSNNWNKYAPEMILVESLSNVLEGFSTNEIYQYLHYLNYQLVAKTFNTMFFKKIT